VRASTAGNGETGDRRWSPVPTRPPGDVTHRPVRFQFRAILLATKPARFAHRAVRCTKVMAKRSKSAQNRTGHSIAQSSSHLVPRPPGRTWSLPQQSNRDSADRYLRPLQSPDRGRKAEPAAVGGDRGAVRPSFGPGGGAMKVGFGQNPLRSRGVERLDDVSGADQFSYFINLKFYCNWVLTPMCNQAKPHKPMDGSAERGEPRPHPSGAPCRASMGERWGKKWRCSCPLT
jgi:hypothetical protein